MIPLGGAVSRFLRSIAAAEDVGEFGVKVGQVHPYELRLTHSVLGLGQLEQDQRGTLRGYAEAEDELAVVACAVRDHHAAICQRVDQVSKRGALAASPQPLAEGVGDVNAQQIVNPC